MADIRSYVFLRHFRTDPTCHVLKYRGGKVASSGRGLAFWFVPMSASIAEVPMDDRELMLMFHTRSSDFQDVAVQRACLRAIQDELYRTGKRKALTKMLKCEGLDPRVRRLVIQTLDD